MVLAAVNKHSISFGYIFSVKDDLRGTAKRQTEHSNTLRRWTLTLTWLRPMWRRYVSSRRLPLHPFSHLPLFFLFFFLWPILSPFLASGSNLSFGWAWKESKIKIEWLCDWCQGGRVKAGIVSAAEICCWTKLVAQLSPHYHCRGAPRHSAGLNEPSH